MTHIPDGKLLPLIPSTLAGATIKSVEVAEFRLVLTTDDDRTIICECGSTHNSYALECFELEPDEVDNRVPYLLDDAFEDGRAQEHSDDSVGPSEDWFFRCRRESEARMNPEKP